MLVDMKEAARDAEQVKNKVEVVNEACEKMVAEIAGEKAIAEQKLETAQPALDEAEEALNTIKPYNESYGLCSYPVQGKVKQDGI